MIGGISARYNLTAVGLVVLLIMAVTFGIYWLPLDLVEFGFGYLIGKAMRSN